MSGIGNSFSEYRHQAAKIKMNVELAQRYYHIALMSYFALFILLMLWNTLLYPSSYFPVALVLIVFVFPLLLPLRGFLHGRKKSTAWLGYISLIYFVHGISEAYVNAAERVYAILEIIFSLLLFLSISFYLRNLKKTNS